MKQIVSGRIFYSDVNYMEILDTFIETTDQTQKDKVSQHVYIQNLCGKIINFCLEIA